MNILYIVTLMIAFTGFSECNSKFLEPKFSFTQTHSFETKLKISEIRILNSLIRINPEDSSFQLPFMLKNSGVILFYSFFKDSILPGYNINVNSFEKSSAYLVKSADSIFRFENNKQKIRLLDGTGKITQEYTIDSQYTPMTIPPLGLQWYKNSILIGNTSKILSMENAENRLVYYREINPVLLLKFANSTLSCMPIINFPESYCNSGNFYYDIFPSICSGENNNICVSFGADDHLYLYNDSVLVLEKTVKSKYIDKFIPFDDAKGFDMLYLQSYLQEEPKYKSVVYDPYESKYYRIVKHRTKKTEEDILKKSWSVIVLDYDFNVLGEVMMDPKFTPDVFIPTPHGIITVNESELVSGKTVISYLKLEKYGK